jgi:putative ABC transport system permease protein
MEMSKSRGARLIEMASYSAELALEETKKGWRATLTIAGTLSVGLCCCLTALAVLGSISAEPLSQADDGLYLVGAPEEPAISKMSQDRPRLIDASQWSLTDAEALVHGASPRQVMLAASRVQIVGTTAVSSPGVWALLTDRAFANAFDVELIRGRNWSAQEENDHARVAIIDDALALRSFGNIEVLGQSVLLDGKPFQVIGISRHRVVRPHFYLLGMWDFANQTEQVAIPIRSGLDAGIDPYKYATNCHEVQGLSVSEVRRACQWVTIWTKLSTVDERLGYEQRLTQFTRSRSDQFGGSIAKPRLYSVHEWLRANRVVPDSVRLNVWFAFSLLALCLANATAILAARAVARGGEIGLRRALGASKVSIAMTHLFQGLLIGLLAGGISVPLTLVGLAIVRTQQNSYVDMVGFDLRLALLLATLCAFTGAIVSMLPAIRASFIEPSIQLKME